MWIQQVEDKFVAIAYNPEKDVSMVMSKPRTSYQETLKWVRGWCGTFCTLPAWFFTLYIQQKLIMFRTLSELRDSINSMIDAQGENAPCAAFVFTQHDVFENDEDDNQEEYFSTLFTHDVLADVGGSSYIYEQVGEMIDDAISLRKKLPLYANWLC